MTANAVHPGRGRDRIAVRLHGHAGGPAELRETTPDRGAEPIVYLAASPEVAGVTGRYFDRCTETRSSAASYDEARGSRLWEESAGWPRWDMTAGQLVAGRLISGMPIYSYRCTACDTEFEQLVRTDTKVTCPGCRGRKLERLMSLTARPAAGGKPADFSRLGPPPGGGCCGGGCHTHQPLTTRLSRLRERLADSPARSTRRGRPPHLGRRGGRAGARSRRRAPDPPGRASGRPMVWPHGAARRPAGGGRLRSRRDRYPGDRRGGRISGSARANSPAASMTSFPEPRCSPPSRSAPSSSRSPTARRSTQSRGRRRPLGLPRPPARPRDPSLRPARHPRRAAPVRRLPGGRRRGLGHDRADRDRPARLLRRLTVRRSPSGLDVRTPSPQILAIPKSGFA